MKELIKNSANRDLLEDAKMLRQYGIYFLGKIK